MNASLKPALGGEHRFSWKRLARWEGVLALFLVADLIVKLLLGPKWAGSETVLAQLKPKLQH